MIRKLLKYINLKGEIEDFEEIHQSIEKGIIFKGTNLWILVFAIIIASVGLNTNSTAVIIGAMLISPLMGPINGMGYSIAINDYILFKRSIKNFTFAVGASLVASTLYFIVSPVSNAQSELLARTSPTIYDVLIALFGGFAGIIAISSKNKGNVIPGVAIATALMPPLCTAGYGLATGQFTFFFGAFYLFTINTVCIALASTAVAQILKFPIRSNIEDARKKRINQIISVILTITILPSIYLGYKLVQNEKFTINAGKYVKSISIYKGNYLLKDEINAEKKQILLVYGGTSFNEEDRKDIIQRAIDFQIDTLGVKIEQGIAFEPDQRDKSLSQENSLRQEINRLNIQLKENEQRVDSIKSRFLIGMQLLTEISPLYPQIESCNYSEGVTYSQDTIDNRLKTSVVIFTTKEKYSLNLKERNQIKEWLQKRLNTTLVMLFFQENDKDR
ncbi:TIGR00341 family protein [Dysgonomonas sp. HDW5B]|uniref:TIGR00341 family protein n=1 Tax=Dysgonomonas sp. HDW5B TaxID=2714927 RepID=UPI00140E8B41|nr:TIGR00341 family protein [Dysgonomonas sp. HDW5B]QIK53892.1 TIGR00341 family protein [Dysgonomonas sp. HDW5B]